MAISRKKKRVLLAIPSFQDPEVCGKERELGPILRLLEKECFDEVILFGLQVWKLSAFLTENAIRLRWPKISIKKYLLPVKNVSVYKDVFYGLREKLADCEGYLKSECEEPMVLLPPSVCDCLLDSWLLLVTSMNIKVRLCQVESHYSMDGIYSQAPEEQNLDWLAENVSEFRDPVAERTPKKAVCLLCPEQTAFLDALCAQRRSFCLKLDNQYNSSLGHYFAQYARQRSSQYAQINCSEIPQEVLDPILWGYTSVMDGGRVIKRRGLMQRVKKGWVTLLGYDMLPKETQRKLRAEGEKNESLHVVGFVNTAEPIEGCNVYVLP